MTERTFTRIFVLTCFAWVGFAIYLGGESKLRQHMILWPGAAAIVAIFLLLDKHLKSRGAIKKEEIKPRVGRYHLLYALGGWILSGIILSLAGIEIYRNRYAWSEGKIWFVGISAACIGIPILVWAVRHLFEVAEESADQAISRLTSSTDGSNEEQVKRFGPDPEKRNINNE